MTLDDRVSEQSLPLTGQPAVPSKHEEANSRPSTLQPPSTPNAPSISNSNSSSRTSISTSSSSSSSAPTTSTTSLTPSPITPHPKYHCHKPQLCPKTGHPINLMSRKYPKPTDEVDVAEALARGWLPGRYAYGGKAFEYREETREERRVEFERVKRELRGWRGV